MFVGGPEVDAFEREYAAYTGARHCVGMGSGTDALEAALRASASPPPDPTPPTAPALSATAFEDHVGLSWTAPSSDGGAQIQRYEVYRGDTSGSATFYANIDSGMTFSDTSVTTGSTYWYQVAAVNSAGVGVRSTEVSATIPEPPPPPPPAEPPSAPTLSASPGNGLVNLSWTVPTTDGGADITAYEIYRSTASGAEGWWQTVDDSVTSVQNVGLTNGTTYYYQVAAVNSAGTGARSNEASATPTAPSTRPSAPRSLKVARVAGGAQLTWLAPTSNGGSSVTSYKVYRTGGAGTVIFTVPGSQLTLTDSTGAPKTWYAYVVSAVNSVGESQASNIVTFKTQ